MPTYSAARTFDCASFSVALAPSDLIIAARLQAYHSYYLDQLLRAAVVAVVPTLGALVDLDLFSNLRPPTLPPAIGFPRIRRPMRYVEF